MPAPTYRHIEMTGTYDGNLLTHTAPTSSILLDADAPAWKRLIGRALPPREVISLIEEIFTNKEEVKMICDLLGDDAQTFINTIHEVRLPSFPSRSTI